MTNTPPLFSIQQTVETYAYLFQPNPGFGLDFYADDFEAGDIVLMDDTKAGSQGIPIHFGYYALFLRLDGKTTRTINQFSYVIEPHSIQLVNPGSIYSFKDITQASRTFVLLFNESFVSDDNLKDSVHEELLSFHCQHPEVVLLDTATYAYVVSIYKQLSDELRDKKEGYRYVAKMLINQLLFLLKREKLSLSIKKNLSRAEEICAEFLILIEKHYFEKKSVKEYAKLLNITPKHLSETVHSTLHHTALSYIHIRVIKEIQYLLCFTQIPIKQITSTLHFDTPSLLGRFFKRHEKMSPKEYRFKHKLKKGLKTQADLHKL